MLRFFFLLLALAAQAACISSELSSKSVSCGFASDASTYAGDAGTVTGAQLRSSSAASSSITGPAGNSMDRVTDVSVSNQVPCLHSSDPHRFVRGGASWYPVGYYPGAAVNMTGKDYAGDAVGFMKYYIDSASSNGIDLFRIWFNWGNIDNPDTDQWDSHIHHPYLRTGPGKAFDGKPKFDLTKFDSTYFDNLAVIVDYAAQKGMVVQALLLDCWHVGYGLSRGFQDRDYFSARNNVNGINWTTESEWLNPKGRVFAYNAMFIENVVETIGDRQNIIWETCNEKRQGDFSSYEMNASDPFHVAVAKVIHEKEQSLGFPRHLVMPVDLPEHRTVAGHRTPTNGIYGQESIPVMRARLIDKQFGWNVPLISDNDCCSGEPDATFVRQKAWAALTAGAHVNIFNAVMWRKNVLSNTNTTNGMRWVGYVQKFLQKLSVNLVGMVPHDELATNGAWVYARPGDEYVVYLVSGGTTQLSGLPMSINAAWFNPRSSDTIPAGSGPTFTAPDMNDWVLHVLTE